MRFEDPKIPFFFRGKGGERFFVVVVVVVKIYQVRNRSISIFCPFEIICVGLFAELFAVIKCLERLERAYGSGNVVDELYTKKCHDLMNQAKINYSTVQSSFKDIPEFISVHQMTCPRATYRFLIGVPATQEHAMQKAGSNNKVILEAVESFVTLLDIISLNPNGFSTDTIMYEMNNALANANQLANQSEVPQMKKLVEWCGKLSKMHATDMIDESDARQMKLDVEQLYAKIRDVVTS